MSAVVDVAERRGDHAGRAAVGPVVDRADLGHRRCFDLWPSVGGLDHVERGGHQDGAGVEHEAAVGERLGIVVLPGSIHAPHLGMSRVEARDLVEVGFERRAVARARGVDQRRRDLGDRAGDERVALQQRRREAHARPIRRWKATMPRHPRRRSCSSSMPSSVLGWESLGPSGQPRLKVPDEPAARDRRLRDGGADILRLRAGLRERIGPQRIEREDVAVGLVALGRAGPGVAVLAGAVHALPRVRSGRRLR